MTKPKNPKPTWVCLVFNALVAADDFVPLGQLIAMTKGHQNQITAALHHLQEHKAVEAVVGANKRLYWFATPESDTRSKRVDERTPEDRPRRVRRTRVNLVPPAPTSHPIYDYLERT